MLRAACLHAERSINETEAEMRRRGHHHRRSLEVFVVPFPPSRFRGRSESAKRNPTRVDDRRSIARGTFEPSSFLLRLRSAACRVDRR